MKYLRKKHLLGMVGDPICEICDKSWCDGIKTGYLAVEKYSLVAQ